MKRRNVLLLVLSLGGILGASSLALTQISKSNGIIGTNADNVSYSFTFDKNTNLPSNGTINVTSSLGNNFLFKTTSFASSESNWGTLAKGGTFYNPYTKEGNNNAIGNIASITIEFTGGLTIDYGWNNNGDEVNYLRTNNKLSSKAPFGFALENPNYIRLNATSDTTITSIKITYKCVTNTSFSEAFRISDEDSLKNFARLVNAGQTKLDAVVTKDIDLSNVTNFAGIGTMSVMYAGSFNGNGHKISNIKITNTKTDDASKSYGLFRTIKGAKISDLTLSNITITSSNQIVGSVVGYSNGGEISNVRVESGSITGSSIVGGIVGYSKNGNTTITNCINAASIKGNGQFVGGIVGGSENPSVLTATNCENNGAISGTSYIGGIIGIMRATGSSSKSTIDGCKNTGAIAASGNSAGGIAGCNRGIVKNCKVSSTSTIKGKAPTVCPMFSTSGGYIVGNNDTGSGAISETELNQLNYSPIWDGTSTKSSFTGEGTSASPYIIEYAEQLAYLSSQVNNKVNQKGKYYTLKTNIDLGSGKWTSIGNLANAAPFSGTFNGSNLKIENITVNQSAADAGFFGYINEGTLKNVNLESVSIINTSTAKDTFTAGAVGRMVRATIAGVTVSGSVTTKGGAVGGVAGEVYSVTGTLINTISDCINKADVTGSSDYAGGILGVTNTNKVAIKNCSNYGKIKTSGNYAGGIAGLLRQNSANLSTVDDCTNYGNVSSKAYAASIIGISRAKVSNSKVLSTASISAGSLTLTALSAPISGDSTTPSAIAYNDTANGGAISGYKFIDKDGNDVAYVGTNFNSSYGRMIKLSNGDYLISCNTGYGIVSSLSEVNTLKTSSYTSSAKDYVRDSSGNDLTDATLDMANPEPIEYSKGKIAVFYRAIKGNYSSIRARISTDNGASFGEPIVLLENIASSTTNPGGLYEPFPVLKEDGNIDLFISCDITSSTNGNNSLKATNGMQNIVRLPLTISNDTFTAGTASIVIKGDASHPRPGMTSLVKLNDGSYAMAFESSKPTSSKYGFAICLSYSKDLINWTSPKEVIVPNMTNSIVTDTYNCQAPYIGILKDGRIAISYMSNENYQGSFYRDSSSLFRRAELAISSKAVSYGNEIEMKKQDTSSLYGSNQSVRYSGLYVENNDVYTLNTKFTLSEKSSKTDDSDKAEIVISKGYLYINKFGF